jgi:DNA-directed RNA polymerase specialized sigma subunit
MTACVKDQLRILRLQLGSRRFRVAKLYFGARLTQHVVARRLRVSQPTVSREVAAVRRLIPILAARAYRFPADK